MRKSGRQLTRSIGSVASACRRRSACRPSRPGDRRPRNPGCRCAGRRSIPWVSGARCADRPLRSAVLDDGSASEPILEHESGHAERVEPLGDLVAFVGDRQAPGIRRRDRRRRPRRWPCPPAAGDRSARASAVRCPRRRWAIGPEEHFLGIGIGAWSRPRRRRRGKVRRPRAVARNERGKSFVHLRLGRHRCVDLGRPPTSLTLRFSHALRQPSGRATPPVPFDELRVAPPCLLDGWWPAGRVLQSVLYIPQRQNLPKCC